MCAQHINWHTYMIISIYWGKCGLFSGDVYNVKEIVLSITLTIRAFNHSCDGLSFCFKCNTTRISKTGCEMAGCPVARGTLKITRAPCKSVLSGRRATPYFPIAMYVFQHPSRFLHPPNTLFLFYTYSAAFQNAVIAVILNPRVITLPFHYSLRSR